MEGEKLNQFKVLLKTIKFFEPFADEELVEFLKLCEVVKFESSSFIIKEKQLHNSFNVILRGKANIVKTTSLSNKYVISSLAEGDCFGEMSMLLNKPATASVMAGGEVFVFTIHPEEVEKLNVDIREKFFRQLAMTLARHLEKTSSKLAG